MKGEHKSKPTKLATPQKSGSVKLPKPNKGQAIPMGLWLSFRRHNPPKRSA